MRIEIQMTNEAIRPESPPEALSGVAGAWVEFHGRVRGAENGRPIAALEYEAYGSMAEAEIRRILEGLAVRHPCLFVRVTHRVGVVPVGEAAIGVGIGARHRTEAFGLLSEFMDRLKQDVPIWKRRAPGEAEAGLERHS